MITLELTPELAKVVRMALIVESEGPRSDFRTETEIEEIEGLIADIDKQIEQENHEGNTHSK